MQTTYPPMFDKPCICDACGNDVEGEPGCTCPATTLERQIQKVRDLRALLSSMEEGIDEKRAAWAACGKTLAEEESRLMVLVLAAYREEV